MENLDVSLRLPESDFWQGKRVLVTGHSGFKGAWLCLWLHRLGADVTGVSLPPATQPNLFTLAEVGAGMQSHWQDVREGEPLAAIFRTSQPEVVFHLAAQALVRPGYRDPLGTFSTNITGTLNVLEAARALAGVRAIVAVTTDKVYRNTGNAAPFLESDPLGGHDPYSASKAAAEMLVASYRESFFRQRGVGLSAARAGNVIGGGDWSEDRLIPDAVRAWAAGGALPVRRPEATRPWQHVLEPLAGYLRLAEALFHDPEAAEDFNFGPDPLGEARVRDVATLAHQFFGAGSIAWGDGLSGPHEAHTLALDNSKAKARLGISPVWPLETSVRHTMQWYRRQLAGDAARALCLADIAAYTSAR